MLQQKRLPKHANAVSRLGRKPEHAIHHPWPHQSQGQCRRARHRRLFSHGAQIRQERAGGRGAGVRGARARRQLHRHRAALRHRRRGRPGAQIRAAGARGGGDQIHRAARRRMVEAGARRRKPRGFTAGHGHRLRRRVQPACDRPGHVRLRARRTCPRACAREGERQDSAYRADREPHRRFHQRGAQARASRPGVGGVRGASAH
jgi:hypothetical protein